MKRRFPVILVLFVSLLLASCGRHKGMFVLHGTVQDDTDTILVVGFDSRFERVDTIVSKNGQFTWSFRPDTVTTLILVFPDGRRHPVFAQKDVKSEMVIPADTALFSVTGGYCNDSYQSYYIESQVDSTIEQAAARIDAFITRDPFSEVTPYLIYDEMVLKYHASQEDLNKLISRMSGNMQDAPYLTDLKSLFLDPVSKTTYVNTLVIVDSIGRRIQFAGLGGDVNHLLVCIWASWDGNRSRFARKDLEDLVYKYRDRNLNVADISIDVNKSRWMEVLRKDSVEWDSYIDTDGWESRIVKMANVQRLPAYVLLTGLKRVLLVTGSMEEMDKELDRVLPKKETKKEELTPKKLRLHLD